MRPARGTCLHRDGAAFHKSVALSSLEQLRSIVPEAGERQAGIRLHGLESLRRLLDADGEIGSLAVATLGRPASPVRALLFDKSLRSNWALGWHQDRTIAVRERAEATGYGPWSVKRGLNHVEPPFEIIAAMITLRIHLDDTPADNAPLLIVPGSHRLGRIPEGCIAEVVARTEPQACLAAAGDVWTYSTPIVHASGRSSGHRHRRVVQVDYSSAVLPDGLDWLGI